MVNQRIIRKIESCVLMIANLNLIGHKELLQSMLQADRIWFQVYINQPFVLNFWLLIHSNRQNLTLVISPQPVFVFFHYHPHPHPSKLTFYPCQQEALLLTVITPFKDTITLKTCLPTNESYILAIPT